MKKIFCLITAVIFITGCDDGDMGYKTFDFSGVDPESCPNNVDDVSKAPETYYKITGTEGLVLILAKGALINSSTINPETGENEPREIALGSTNTLTYYDFVNKPTGSLCTKSEIPAAKENGIWIGEGTLSVTTLPNLDDNDKLTGYTHTITLKNISFNQGNEKITIVDSPFGDIIKKLDFDFDFIADGADAPVVEVCDTNNNLIYTRQSTETLSLNITNFEEIFDQAVETDTIDLAGNTDDIVVLFNEYKSSATEANVCNQGSEVPSLPIQQWQMVDGQLIVITTETGGIYSHDIYLKDALFSNALGDIFLLNNIVDVGPNGYYFGKY